MSSTMAPVRNSRRPLQLAAIVVALTLALSACATTGSLTTARNAETRQDYDRAVAEYTRILRENPDNQDARLGLERAKLRASQDHFARGRRLAATGKLEEALVEYPDCRGAERRPAARSRPSCGCPRPAADQGRRSGRRQDAARDAHRPEPGGAAAWRRPARRRQPARVAGLSRSQRPRHLHRHRQVRQHQRGLRSDVSRSVGHHRSARTPHSSQALTSVASATRNFWQVTAPRTVTIIPDTPAKRREYEEEVVRTFYLSNADLKETIDMLRIVVDARRLAPIDRHQRHHHQGHARAGDRGGPDHHRHRQGAAGSGHRRRAARSRSHAAAGVRPADRLARELADRHRRPGRHQSRTDSRCATCRT